MSKLNGMIAEANQRPLLLALSTDYPGKERSRPDKEIV